VSSASASSWGADVVGRRDRGARAVTGSFGPRQVRIPEIFSERAAAWQESGDLDHALGDLSEAIRLRKPEYARVRGEEGLFAALNADSEAYQEDVKTEDVCVELSEVWMPARILERRRRLTLPSALDEYNCRRKEARDRYCRRALILKQKGQRDAVLRDATAALEFGMDERAQALRSWALATDDEE
jgi:hypothetical protein